jgi:hypothetical protein
MVNVIDLVKIRDIMNDPESACLDQFDKIFVAILIDTIYDFLKSF